MNRYLNLSKLITFNSVLLVRDAQGRPKEVPFGTATRLLLTSQTTRRAERTHLREQASLGEGPLASHSFGQRTREWSRATAERLAGQYSWPPQEAADTARGALRALNIKFGTTPATADLTKVMIFAPEGADERLAQALDAHRTELGTWLQEAERVRSAQEKAKRNKRKKTDPNAEAETDAEEDDEQAKTPPLPKGLREQLLTALAPADAIDIALFGRFLAEIADSPNVDGALQTMGAISVGPAAVADDFFCAADDRKIARQARPSAAVLPPTLDALSALDHVAPFPADAQGAGMTGYQSLVSGTFYAHTVLDRYQLRQNLRRSGMDTEAAEAAAVAAEQAYLEAFCLAVPAAKKTSTAAPGTLPKLVLAFSSNRPHNYAACFEDAIHEQHARPASLQATDRLLDHHQLITRKFGLEPGTVLTYDLAITALLDERRTTGQLACREVDQPDQLTSPAPAHLPQAASPADERSGQPA
ncbi:type I-E CRISPR-associated protein Cas7/Cse4/CasC [Streptomyces noboritoensis]|uniref:Type I-E CRISPR-associated protein Cas7/Cse4/CasC n=1 Tax=Streptomyces noboritoensis TaxID=67337 RepID=A0ABV6TCJ2_9ACTN